MASPAALLRAAKASPGGARPTPPPQGPGIGQVSPLAAQLANERGYANAYGPFLPRPSADFTEGAFGPFSPILPVPVDKPADDGRAGPRREQYEVGWNLPVGQPGTEGIKLASFQTLRVIADLYSVARAAIQVRKNEIKGVGWDIVPTSEAAKAMRGSPSQAKDFGKRQATAKKFFERPDPDYFTWSSFIGDAMEQMMVFDALSVWLAPKRGRGMGKGLLGSDLDCLQLVDGQTIRPLYDLHGATPRPPAPAYQQYLYGVPRADLTSVWTGRDLEEAGMSEKDARPFRGDQLLYLPVEKRRWTPYGFAPVERALLPIMAGLQKQSYALDFFREGTVPAVYISPGDTAMTPNQIRELQDALNAITGDPAWHHKIIVLPPGSRTEPQRPAQLADQFDEIVMNWVCMAFDVQPMEMGISPRVSTTMSPGAGNQMAKQSQSSQERKATKPTLEFLAAICDFVLHEVCGQEDMRFLFDGLEEDEDELTKTNVIAAQINVGLSSIDEGREELGKQPWGLPETSDPIWASATGPVPLGQVDATGKPVAGQPQPGGPQAAGQQPGQPGQPPAPGQPPQEPPQPGGPRKPPPGGSDGNAGQSPGHEAAEAAAQTRDRTARQPASSGGTGKSATAEMDALACFLKGGGRVTAWQPYTLTPEVLASVSELLAKGLAPDLAVRTAAALVLKDAPPAGAGQPRQPPQDARQWPGWELDTALASVYTAAIAAAFARALKACAGHIRDWMAGKLKVSRDVLVTMIRGQVAQQIAGPLRDLWREAWYLGDRSALAMATMTGPDWGGWKPGDPEAAAIADTADGLRRLLASHGVETIKAVSETGMDDLAAALGEALENGDPADSLARRLPEILRVPQRARMIAVTEIARAVSHASLERYERQGVTRKEWATAPDTDVCPRCKANARQGAIPLGEPFDDGSPCPPGHPSCRCALLPAFFGDIDLENPDGDGKATAPDLAKVGPKGYIHGWIFVGVPAAGDKVFHPRHGEGTVTGHDGKHVHVMFESGAKSFEHAKRPDGSPHPEPGKLVPREEHEAREKPALPEGVSIAPHSSGTQHVTSPYDKAFIAGLKRIGAHWLPRSKAWSVPAGHDDELHALIGRAFGAKPEAPSVRAASLPGDVSVRVRPNGKTEVKGPFNDGFRREARSIGGAWDPAERAWVFPPHRDSQARAAAARHYGDGSDWKKAQDDHRRAREDARRQAERKPAARAATPAQVDFALRMIRQNGGMHDLPGWSGPAPTKADLAAMTTSEISALIDDLKSTRGW